MGLTLKDSHLQTEAGSIVSVIKEPPSPARPVPTAIAALPALGCPQPLSLVRAQRRGPQRNMTAEPLRFGDLNVYSPSTFLVKSVQVEIS